MTAHVVTDSKKEPCADFHTRNANQCAKCGRPFTDHDALFRGYRKQRGFFGGCSTTFLWVCERCARPDIQALADTHQGYCGHCARLMVAPRPVRYCSPACNQAAIRERRKQTERQQITCLTCNAGFIPPRADARYCSPACRQKAYRQRRAQS